jgi:superkiller protein 3
LQFFGEGRYDEAAACYQKALRLNPRLAIAYNNLGILYDHIGEVPKAIQMYRREIALDPNSTKAYINLANAYDETDRPDSAMFCYRKALALDPRNVDAYENMGIAYLKQGDRINAVAALKNAAQLGSPDAQQFLKENGETW